MARRENGTGSIYQRKDGYWVGRILAGTKPNGRGDYKVVYGKTEQEAKRKLKELIKQIHSSEYLYVRKQSVKEFMTDWLTTVKVNDLKPKSYDRLEQTLEKDVFPYIGSLQVNGIAADDVQKMINGLREDGRSYSTIKKAYNAVNACFTNGLQRQKVKVNPCYGVILPNSKLFKKKQIQFFTQEEAASLVSHALSTWSNGTRRYPLGDFVPLLLNTGLRLGEVLALQWDRDVNLDAGTITVHKNIVTVRNRQDSGPKYKVVEQDDIKTDSGQDRVIPLNDAAQNALRSLKNVTGDSLYVLTTKNGTQVKQRQLDQMFRRIQLAAGCPDDRIYGLHSLRHTFATLLIYNGTDVKVVSKLLGHSDISITYNTYVHIIKEQEAKAVQSIPNLT